MGEDILSYLAGIIASDGNITCIKRTCKIKIITTNKKFAERIARLLEQTNQCRKAKIYHDLKHKRYEVYCYSKKLAEVLLVDYGIRPGKKADKIILPSLGREQLISYIRGLYDGDSSVTVVRTVMNKREKKYEYLLPRILYKTKSKPLADSLIDFLRTLGFKPRRWRDKEIHVIALEGVTEIKRFKEIVGYSHPSKRCKISSILKNYASRKYYGAGGRRRGSA